jgi:hypothetical protein
MFLLSSGVDLEVTQTSGANVPALRRSLQDSLQHQSPEHQDTRLPIDIQQPLGLSHRHVESGHFRILCLNPPRQIVNRRARWFHLT